MNKLAINGGSPVRTKPFPSQITVGKEEEEAVVNVIRTGRLSHFRGCWNENFYGGEQILALEKEWAEKFNVKHAISVNSCTSGLIVACGAIGLAPGDEVIVTPWSMSCSATAPLWWNAIPVFADIEYDHYCLDPDSIEQRITDRTKAIIVVDLFGQPYNVEAINAIAKKHGLMVIEDAAQAIGSHYLPYPNVIVNDSTSIGSGSNEADRWKQAEPKYAGTIGHLGVYSLTHGKHLTSGEGGVIVTNDSDLAFRCQLIRNHAESVVNDMEGAASQPLLPRDNNNMLGLNVRMTEVAAAIARCQLRKLDGFIEAKRKNVKLLGDAIADIPAIRPSPIRPDCTHSYYAQAFKWYDNKADGLHRDKYIEAVKAELTPEEGRESEGVPIGCGYIKPLYLFPLFQSRKLYGGTDYPWPSNVIGTQHWWATYYGYSKGICPIAERLWRDELWLWRLQSLPLTEADVKDVGDAFAKVWEHRKEL
jgi:dTDP-4-amino-4,6-dideoxygalactose transaminase